MRSTKYTCARPSLYEVGVLLLCAAGAACQSGAPLSPLPFEGDYADGAGSAAMDDGVLRLPPASQTSNSDKEPASGAAGETAPASSRAADDAGVSAPSKNRAASSSGSAGSDASKSAAGSGGSAGEAGTGG